MRTVRRSFTEDAAKTMVHAFVTSRIDYCNSVIHVSSAVHIRPLQNALNAAARLQLHKRKFDHITADVRDRLHWLPLQQQVEYKVSLLVYKCLRQQLHHIWLRCAFLSQQPTTHVTSALQHTATWQFHESDWQDAEEKVSLCLVRCCGTHYH